MQSGLRGSLAASSVTAAAAAADRLQLVQQLAASVEQLLIGSLDADVCKLTQEAALGRLLGAAASGPAGAAASGQASSRHGVAVATAAGSQYSLQDTTTASTARAGTHQQLLAPGAADASAGGHCGPLLAGRLAALASMRQLRRSSVAESPDVVPCSSDSINAAAAAAQMGGRAQQQRGRGSLLGSSAARSVAALLDVSTSGSFLQQQLQQLRGPEQQEASGQGGYSGSLGSDGGSSGSDEGNSGSDGQQLVSQPAAAAPATGEQLPVGSPIEGLGALRQSWSKLPTGPRSRPGSAAAVRLSLSEERLAYERSLQQQGPTGA